MNTSLSRTNTNSSRRRPFHDKTSYGIIATPPSPTNTSPTLTQSTSNSNSTPSTSPPLPTTPPRTSRSRTRYPDLGRVPLHRRGKSKTYERLEDLLREAGYKETRVFTPEGERTKASSAQQDAQSSGQQGGVRHSVGAFVGFLAGFMPNAAASRSTSSLGVNPEEGHVYSPPASPLNQMQAQKQKQKQRQDTSSSSEHHSPMTSLMTSSIESLEPTPRPPRRRPPSRSTTPLPPASMYSHLQSSQQDLHRPTHRMVHRASDQYPSTSSRRPALQSYPSQTSLYHHPGSPMPSAGSSQHIVHPQPSRAHAYLRHMASQPNMPKRPNSTPVQQQRRSTLILNDSDSDTRHNENDSDVEPPLPRTWLESVARAVLFGGMGAYVGGPSAVDPAPPSLATRGQGLRPTRSSLSQTSLQQQAKHPRRPHVPRSGLSDQTNTNTKQPAMELPLALPELFMRIERGRAGTSAGEVSRTRVMCHSAPASRASSVVRGDGEDGREKRDRVRSGKEREHGKRARGRAVVRDRLPSLANTRTEGDGWASGTRVREGGESGRNRYLSGWGMEAESSDQGGMSSSEEDGELNLATMLVNPKRQNSIKSLRKHLAAADDGSASSQLMKASGTRAGRGMVADSGSSRSGSVRKIIPEEQDWHGSEAEEWGRGWVRKNARRKNSDDDDDDETYAAKFLGEGRSDRAWKGSGRLFGSGRSGTGRTRFGIPGPWAPAGGGS